MEFSRYNDLIKTLQSDEFFHTHHVVELPRFLLKGLKTFLHKLPPPFAQPEQPVLSTYMLDTLLPFQLEGLKFVIARKGKAMIADEMVCVLSALVVLITVGALYHVDEDVYTVSLTSHTLRLTHEIHSIPCLATLPCYPTVGLWQDSISDRCHRALPKVPACPSPVPPFSHQDMGKRIGQIWRRVFETG